MHDFVKSHQHYVSWYTSELRVKLIPFNIFKTSSRIFAERSKAWSFSGSVLFSVLNFYAISSVPCSLVITSWGLAVFLVLLCVVVTCVFVTFSYGDQGQVWYLLVSILDLCLPLYLNGPTKRTLGLYELKFHIDNPKGKGMKVSKSAKIRNRYNQVPHLTQDTNWKVTNS